MRNKAKIAFRLSLVFLAILALAWFVLNFLAPNPTQRWYSTELLDVITTTSSQRGTQGEDVLASDLGLDAPTNERSNNSVCLCGMQYSGTSPAPCGSCLVYSANISNYRIPDFATRTYIAESKNRVTLLVSDSDTLAQLTEMAAGARAFGIPLYIYVRVNSIVDPEYFTLAQSTGGDVVRYFVVDGFEFLHVFEAAINGLLIFVLVLAAGAGLWVYIMSNSPSEAPEKPNEDIEKTEDSINETEEFLKRMERLSKRSKDEDDKKGKS